MSPQTASLDWDAWRSAYPTMTYADQQAFHSEIYKAHPEQRHYDAAQVALAIEHVQPATVVELGGWDGELAHSMLDEYEGIEYWSNVEICTEAVHGRMRRAHPRYVAPAMNDWYWTLDWTADLFVASHVIEHLSAEHFQATIAATDAKAMLFDAPLDNRGHPWPKFTGTHILDLGWRDINRIMDSAGYRLAWEHSHGTDESSGGRARAFLYERSGH